MQKYAKHGFKDHVREYLDIPSGFGFWDFVEKLNRCGLVFVPAF
jgi:hypothetical protein